MGCCEPTAAGIVVLRAFSVLPAARAAAEGGATQGEQAGESGGGAGFRDGGEAEIKRGVAANTGAAKISREINPLIKRVEGEVGYGGIARTFGEAVAEGTAEQGTGCGVEKEGAIALHGSQQVVTELRRIAALTAETIKNI